MTKDQISIRIRTVERERASENKSERARKSIVPLKRGVCVSHKSLRKSSSFFRLHTLSLSLFLTLSQKASIEIGQKKYWNC